MTLSEIFNNEDNFFTPGWLRYYDNDIADGLSPLEALADQLADAAANNLQQMVVDGKKQGSSDTDFNRWVEAGVAEYREKHKYDQLPANLQPGLADKVIAVVYGNPNDVSNVAESVAEGIYVDRSLEDDKSDEEAENEDTPEDQYVGDSDEEDDACDYTGVVTIFTEDGEMKRVYLHAGDYEKLAALSMSERIDIFQSSYQLPDDEASQAAAQFEKVSDSIPDFSEADVVKLEGMSFEERAEYFKDRFKVTYQQAEQLASHFQSLDVDEDIQSLLKSHFNYVRNVSLGASPNLEAGFAQLLTQGKHAILDKQDEINDLPSYLQLFAAAAGIDLRALQKDLCADETLLARMNQVYADSKKVDTPVDEEQPDFDIVQKAKHYNSHASGVECIEIVEQMTFCTGNAVKYVWRRGDKGNERQDLEKARYYVTREIDRLSQLLKFVPLYILRKYKSNNTFTEDMTKLCDRVVDSETNPEVSQFYSRLFKQVDVRDYKQELVKARNCLDTLLDNLE